MRQRKDQSINESRLSSDEEDDEKSERIEPDGQSLDKSIFNTDTVMILMVTLRLTTI